MLKHSLEMNSKKEKGNLKTSKLTFWKPENFKKKMEEGKKGNYKKLIENSMKIKEPRELK